jgi:NADPH-dependent glutamate synthase beta subunit-like oxidoreductase
MGVSLKKPEVRMVFDVTKLKGADISTEFCGVKLQSPFVLSSGPLSYAAEGLIRAHQAGAGAVVTKTIRLSAAINPVNHIAKINGDSLINCEKWADSKAEVWFEREIPLAKAAGAVVIASVGHTLPEAEALVKDCEKAGADFIELVSYTEDTLIPMLRAAKERVSIPVICKLSGNWPDPVGTARKCLEIGADAISAIDSLGPTLKIDIRNARPAMFSKDGYGWLSGGAMRPISLRINSEIARNGCENLMGIGGVTCAEDAVEYLMVGARAIGLHSIAILKGVEYFSKLCKDTAILLDQLGYHSVSSAVGVALPNFPKQERVARLEFQYQPDFAPCQKACPAGVDVPLYLDQVRRGNYVEAYQTVSAANPLPAICGRVCDHPCESQCRRNTVDEALQIRLLKRAAADQVFASCGGDLPVPAMLPKKGQRVAIVGSGPAGLSAAFFLARAGYDVTIFEALPVAGGMLAVGIPEYRLPKDVLQAEIARIARMGVQIRTGARIGRDLTIKALQGQGYAAVLIAVGAQGNADLKIPGEQLDGVVPGLNFLRDISLGRAGGLQGRRVVVIGGGNVAIDAARSALRLGAASVTVAYRRTRNEMPAYAGEVAAAEREGVKFIFLAGPHKLEGNGRVELFYYLPMQLGAPDESGRRRPVPSGAAPLALNADVAIVAVGQKVDADFLPALKGGAGAGTEASGIFAAGDCATGPASVIEAIAAGRTAAAEIDRYLGGDGQVQEEIRVDRLHFVEVAESSTAREQSGCLPAEQAVSGWLEVESGLQEDAARREATRCLHCGCINCGRCVAACSYDARNLDFPVMKVDQDLCRSCGLCVSVCPTGALTATVVD